MDGRRKRAILEIHFKPPENMSPNCGGIWFEGRDYDSRKAPVLGPCGKRWHAADDSHFTMSQIDMDPPPELLASWRRLGWGRRR